MYIVTSARPPGLQEDSATGPDMLPTRMLGECADDFDGNLHEVLEELRKMWAKDIDNPPDKQPYMRVRGEDPDDSRELRIRIIEKQLARFGWNS